MTDQETIILVCALVASFLALILINLKEWKSLFWLMLFAAVVGFFLAFLDTEEPREPNQTILEQQREKWRDNKEEAINGSSNTSES